MDMFNINTVKSVRFAAEVNTRYGQDAYNAEVYSGSTVNTLPPKQDYSGDLSATGNGIYIAMIAVGILMTSIIIRRILKRQEAK